MTTEPSDLISNNIQISLNNQRVWVAKSMNLHQLIVKMGYGTQKYAVAINQQFIPKTLHSETFINPNDEIDIVTPMQGG